MNQEKFLPNLSFLKKKGLFSEIIVNGQATKFVMPSVFTQTFPLDYGGYNSVIKKRPKSFVEILKKMILKLSCLKDMIMMAQNVVVIEALISLNQSMILDFTSQLFTTNF